MSDATIQGIAQQCDSKHVAPPPEKISAAIAGAAMRHGAEAGLVAHGVSVTDLDKVWRVAEAQRAALLVAVQDQEESPEAAKQLFSTVDDLIRLAGGSSRQQDPMTDPVFRLYADYFLGRAIEESSASARP